MIVIPRLLRSLLEELDEDTAATLALDYAEQSLRATGGELSAELLDSSIGYVTAARNFLGGAGTAGLRVAHERFFEGRSQVDGLSATASWIAAISVLAACQRDMEQAGIISHNAYRPTVVDVSGEAQKIAGRLAGRADEAQLLRWEAARQQLILLIGAVKFPGRS